MSGPRGGPAKLATPCSDFLRRRNLSQMLPSSKEIEGGRRHGKSQHRWRQRPAVEPRLTFSSEYATRPHCRGYPAGGTAAATSPARSSAICRSSRLISRSDGLRFRTCQYHVHQMPKPAKPTTNNAATGQLHRVHEQPFIPVCDELADRNFITFATSKDK
jgi:hypothetical protein